MIDDVELAPEGVRATPVARCRSCGEEGLRPFLSLGATPIANALVGVAAEGEDPCYPLEVGFCPACSLVQVTHELPAGVIFDADYAYFSSFSDMLVRHSATHVDDLVAARGLDADSFVVELASNDGYLLRRFGDHGVPGRGGAPPPRPARPRPPAWPACPPGRRSSGWPWPRRSAPSTVRRTWCWPTT